MRPGYLGDGNTYINTTADDHVNLEKKVSVDVRADRSPYRASVYGGVTIGEYGTGSVKVKRPWKVAGEGVHYSYESAKLVPDLKNPSNFGKTGSLQCKTNPYDVLGWGTTNVASYEQFV